MVELNISSKESNQRLNKFVMKYLNKAPSSFVYKMLRKKNITLNGKKAKGDEILMDGDIVKLFLSDETIASFRENQINNKPISNINTIDSSKLIVLYKDEHIMAVHKPAGMLSQKTKEDDISINEVIISYCDENKITNGTMGFKPSIANRLDRNTSGIILAGISLKGSQNLAKMLKDRTGDKYYFTIVRGDFKNKLHSIAYINKDTSKNTSTVITENQYNNLLDKEKQNYHYIETSFLPVSGNGNYTLLKIKLITGKSHQIRAHLKSLGHEIVGDTKYGNIDTNRYMRDKYKLKHHLLHSGVFKLGELTIIDKLPENFLKICKGEGINTENIY